MRKLILLFLLIPLVSLGQTFDFKETETIPIFPGCENVKNKRKCFQKKMDTHIKNNFEYPFIYKENKIEGSAYVKFIIKKDSTVSDIKARGSNIHFESSAIKIIEKLPNIVPGTISGKPVDVSFSIKIDYNMK